MELKPTDIFFTRGSGLISRAIRIMTRSIGEPRTQINHVGLAITDHLCIEAVGKGVIVRDSIPYYLKHGDQIAIYRPINLDWIDKENIINKAMLYEGKTYGFVKMITHFLDWLLLGAYVFRRLTNTDRYPICSWLVAQSYRAASKDFGVAAGAATPDDIWDFVVNNPDKYTCIVSLPIE